MHICVGDQVRILNEPVEGVVLEIRNEQEILVHTSDGFDYSYPASELIKVNSEDDSVEFEVNKSALVDRIVASQNEQNIHPVMHDGPRYLKPYLDRGMIRNRRGDAIVEIDLHLEMLVRHPGKLNNHEKLHVQLQHFQHCLEEAMRLKINHLVFIHGIGEGKLKDEIRQILHSYPNVEYGDAEFVRYGRGATQVKIRGLFAG